jgi:hypothetical protein
MHNTNKNKTTAVHAADLANGLNNSSITITTTNNSSSSSSSCCYVNFIANTLNAKIM